jgi:Protein of unknown function (DUF1573)
MKKITLVLLFASGYMFAVAQKDKKVETAKPVTPTLAVPTKAHDHDHDHDHGKISDPTAPANVKQATIAAPAKEFKLLLKETEHDFGKIPQGKPVTYEFEVKNGSNEPLKLDDVRASCGCTTPEWKKDPIEPGATAKIKVGFNAYADGYFQKDITIVYGTQSSILKITGTVWKAPATAAPENASVQLLKNIQ